MYRAGNSKENGSVLPWKVKHPGKLSRVFLFAFSFAQSSRYRSYARPITRYSWSQQDKSACTACCMRQQYETPPNRLKRAPSLIIPPNYYQTANLELP